MVYDYFDTTYHFYGSPVYSVWLAGVLGLFNRHEASVVILQAALFAGTALLVYRITRALFGAGAAWVAAGLAALHPGGLVYVGKLHAQTLDTLLITATFAVLIGMTVSTRPLAALAGGLLVGLAGLSRGTVLPVVLGWAIWFFWRAHPRRAQAAVVVMALALGVAAVLAPIIARGHARYGALLPLRTDAGINFWYGNHPGASGTSYTLDPMPQPVTTQLPAELTARLPGMNELEQNEAFMQAALDYVRQSPREAAVLVAKKLGYFWWASPHTGLRYPAAWTRMYQLYYVLIVLLTLAGLGLGWWKARRGVALFALMATGICVSQALFYVEGRHRWQLEPLMLVFAGAALWYGLQAARRMTLRAADAT
jgi:4-amino-4-deoxy-L-arabinose transferase-like glycosyltransferase